MDPRQVGPRRFQRFVARRLGDESEQRWGVYDRAIGSWPVQRPGLGVVRQHHRTRDYAELEARRCERWYLDQGCSWDGRSIADSDLKRWLLIGTDGSTSRLGTSHEHRRDVALEPGTGGGPQWPEQQVEPSIVSSPVLTRERSAPEAFAPSPLRCEPLDEQQVRSRSADGQAASPRHISLIRDAHPDLLDVDLAVLSSPTLPEGRGIYYFVRANGTGTDVIVASSLGAAIELHKSVDSGRGEAFWAPGPLNRVLEESPAIREAKSGRIGRPRLVRSELDWAGIPPGAGIYRIRLLGEDPARPPVAVYIGRSGNFKLRPRRHEKIPLNVLGQQQFGGPLGVDRIELIYAVADGPDMWNSRTLDAMEEKHIARAVKRHEMEPDLHPRVVNVTAGRNGPPSNPRAHLFVWPVEDDAPRNVI